MVDHKGKAYIRRDITNYILKYYKRGHRLLLTKISKKAMEQIIDELDKIIQYISSRLKNQNDFVNGSTLTKDMFLTSFPIMNKYYNTYNFESITFFHKDHLKRLFNNYIFKYNTEHKYGQLNITDDAYVEILKAIHKRFDKMITMALLLTSSRLSSHGRTEKLYSDVIIISGENLRICLEEYDE
jgi:hypothetical protein